MTRVLLQTTKEVLIELANRQLADKSAELFENFCAEASADEIDTVEWDRVGVVVVIRAVLRYVDVHGHQEMTYVFSYKHFEYDDRYKKESAEYLNHHITFEEMGDVE